MDNIDVETLMRENGVDDFLNELAARDVEGGAQNMGNAPNFVGEGALYDIEQVMHGGFEAPPVEPRPATPPVLPDGAWHRYWDEVDEAELFADPDANQDLQEPWWPAADRPELVQPLPGANELAPAAQVPPALQKKRSQSDASIASEHRGDVEVNEAGKENMAQRKPAGKRARVESVLTAGVDRKGKTWVPEETSTLLEYCLGPDADSVYSKVQSNAAKIWEKIAKSALNGNHFTGLRTLFGYVHDYMSITGGEGDADLDVADDQAIEEHLGRLRENKKAAADKLSVKVIQAWMEHGWYDWFNTRYGKHPSVVRKTPFQTGRLSPPPPAVHAARKDGDPPTPPARAQPLPSSSKQGGVPEPAHVPNKSSSNAASSLMDTFTTISGLIQKQTEGSSLSDIKEGLNAAQMILGMEGIDEGVKAQARESLTNLSNALLKFSRGTL
ncbi:uncharacterized protein B0H18DRAFT_956134 [Fomitopsis serialis]|uniref:uncharacterized protein n=1 Tax=Fomitopsis serialis TaxID=139415 RepID=UPI002007799B|nr:uncharacterized protein B0H18DRAFT_956134 [Neoantrodia serialis]KAH9922767.1 hypothetical protein B0H18DRAFT_956134 [Neoantrodia serialis]